jgi:hypothetical protein
MRAGDGRLVHVYGVLDADGGVRLPARGIGGEPVELVRCGALAALASELDAGEFGPAVWEAHADDPRWLGAVATAHHEVLQAVADQVDVVPLRLPGLHQDREAVATVVDEDGDALRVALEGIRGHVEWGAKIFAGDRPGPDESAGPPRTGRDYLAHKAEAARRRQELARTRDRLVSGAHERLAAASTRAVANPPQSSVLTGREEPMLLNGAYLVPRASGEGLLRLATELGDELYREGLLLEVSGPWPAYNFATAGARTTAGEVR